MHLAEKKFIASQYRSGTKSLHLEISKKQNVLYELDKQIRSKKRQIEEMEQKMYENAQGENFRKMRPIFTEER